MKYSIEEDFCYLIYQLVIGDKGLILHHLGDCVCGQAIKEPSWRSQVKSLDQRAAACREKLLRSPRNGKCNLILHRNPYPRMTVHHECKCVAEQVKNKRHAGQHQIIGITSWITIAKRWQRFGTMVDVKIYYHRQV